MRNRPEGERVWGAYPSKKIQHPGEPPGATWCTIHQIKKKSNNNEGGGGKESKSKFPVYTNGVRELGLWKMLVGPSTILSVKRDRRHEAV